MDKPRNKFADYLAYLALRLFAMFVHMFSCQANYAFAAFLGNLYYRFDKRHREMAIKHLRACFPDWPEQKYQRVARASMRHMLYLVMDVLLTTREITQWKWRQHIVFSEVQEIFDILLKREKSVVMISGHFGSWEVSGYTMAAVGFNSYALARPLDNPYLNKYLLGQREKMGMKILDKFGAMQRIEKIVKSRSMIGFIADQDAGQRGMFVDFFGRPASTYRAPAFVAIKHKIPVAIGYGRRIDEKYKFELGVDRIIHPHEWADKEDPAQWITQQFTSSLERIIRKAPEQYLWTYRRWKTHPKVENAAEKE